MILAFTMPEWWITFWSAYGGPIITALMGVVVAVITYVGIKIRTAAKINAAKADLQIEALKEVANREDNVPELEKQAQRLEAIEKTLVYITEMFYVAFQNSQLTPEIKENLTSLKNKILYGTEDELVKALENTITNLKDQVDTLSQNTTQVVADTVVEEIRKRTRR